MKTHEIIPALIETIQSDDVTLGVLERLRVDLELLLPALERKIEALVEQMEKESKSQ